MEIVFVGTILVADEQEVKPLTLYARHKLLKWNSLRHPGGMICSYCAATLIAYPVGIPTNSTSVCVSGQRQLSLFFNLSKCHFIEFEAGSSVSYVRIVLAN